MGNKNITIQDTQKESQEKDLEINSLKTKVDNNELIINNFEKVLVELSIKKKEMEDKID